MDERHADERNRIRIAARARAVQETSVLVDVRHHLGTPGLRHRAGDAFAQTVVTVRLLPLAETARRFNGNLVAVKESERAAKHAHALLKDVQNLLQNVTHVPLANQNGTDLPQHVNFRGQLRFHGAYIISHFAAMVKSANTLSMYSEGASNSYRFYPRCPTRRLGDNPTCLQQL